MLDLNVMYPYILKEYGVFDSFLECDRNKKAFFFNKFLEKEYLIRMDAKPSRDKINCKNRLLQIIWDVQGFLGYISRERDLRANHKLIENMTPNPTFINPINVDDVFDLFDEAKARDRKALKIEFFTGYNPVDLLGLTLSDFRTINDEFYYIHKKRQKTWKKKINYLNIFDNNFYYEIARYCDRKNISENELIFPITPSGLWKSYKRNLIKNNLNPHTTPKYIRQLAFTRIEPVLGEESSLFRLWTQHAAGVLSTYYVKKYITKFIERYPKICDAVLIGSLKQSQQKIKFLKDEIHTKLDIINTRITDMEEHNKTDDKIDEILTLIKKRII